MSDHRIRELERRAMAGPHEYVMAYVKACLRAGVYPKHAMAVVYMQSVLDDALSVYSIEHYPPRHEYLDTPDIEYLTISYDFLIDLVELGRKINVSIRDRKRQSYKASAERRGREFYGLNNCEIKTYYLSMDHYDEFGFQELLDAGREDAELITYTHESGFPDLEAQFGGQGISMAWPYGPRSHVNPNWHGRMFWYGGSLEFIGVEEDFTYGEILHRAMLSPRD